MAWIPGRLAADSRNHDVRWLDSWQIEPYRRCGNSLTDRFKVIPGAVTENVLSSVGCEEIRSVVDTARYSYSSESFVLSQSRLLPRRSNVLVLATQDEQ